MITKGYHDLEPNSPSIMSQVTRKFSSIGPSRHFAAISAADIHEARQKRQPTLVLSEYKDCQFHGGFMGGFKGEGECATLDMQLA